MSSNAIRKYRLREVRKSRGKTGYEVAEYLNMSPQYYYELEREDKSIKGRRACHGYCYGCCVGTGCKDYALSAEST